MKKIITFLSLIMILTFFKMNVFCMDSMDIEEQLNSEDYLLINLDNNSDVFAKNADKKIYPASMTKVMTAIIIIENTRDFNKEIILTDDDISLYEQGAAVTGLESGSVITVNDALYGMLLASSADVAHAAAVHFAGTEDEFVKIMNAKAKSLNMKDTHFSNSTGMEDENHYTTLRDSSKLFKYCLENEKFMEIQKEEEYKMDLLNQSKTFEINSYSRLLFRKHGFNPDFVIAAKTGYTYQAGDCMVSVASKNNMSFMFLSAEAPSYNSEVKLNVVDAMSVYNYVFNNYIHKKCYDRNQIIDKTTLEKDVYFTLPKSLDLKECTTKINNNHIIIEYQGNTIANLDLKESKSDFPIGVLYLSIGILFVLPYLTLYFKSK